MYDALQTSRDALSELKTAHELLVYSLSESFRDTSCWDFHKGLTKSHWAYVVALKGFPNGNKGGCEEGAEAISWDSRVGEVGEHL